jgi:NADPH:quinone reductase-like Zn-dependent oxidoreductase
MKAYVLSAFGGPERLTLTDVDRPTPGGGEVLVRVRATSVNPYDWHFMRGEPRVARLTAGMSLRRPPIAVLGCDMAGRVEAVGPHVTGFAPGDDVYGLLLGGGGFGEYVSVPADRLVPKPANVSYEEAAAVPMAGITALVGLRHAGQLRSGQRVLVTGASGGVGSFAVQIAKADGASVTGVCGPSHVDLVKSIGADEVIDYRATDFTRTTERYDLVLDCAGGPPVSACRKVLTRTGTFVMVGGQAGRWVRPAERAIATLLQNPFVSQRMVVAEAVKADLAHGLRDLTVLIESGQVTPVVDRRHPFADLPDAVRYQEAGHAAGKVVVSV